MVALATKRLGSGAALVLLVYGVLTGCGGESLGDDKDDDGSSGEAGESGGTASGGATMGGSAGTASGAGGSGGAGSTTGGAATGGASTGGASTGGATTGGASTGGATTGGASTGGASAGGAGGGAGEPSVCFLDVDPGPCRAAIPRFAFDAATGLCLPFTYGGCGGNANNFETPDHCYEACDAAASAASRCATPSDCTLMRSRCCGCEAPTLGNMVGVNARETSTVFTKMGCDLVDCVACIVSDPPLAVTCREGHCIAVDLTH